MKIKQADIVREALILLNEVGLDRLSTRMLASRLGVQQPAIYWHFKDKRALMDAMNAEMMRTANRSRCVVTSSDWKDFLLKNSTGFRHALLSYRDGARVHAGSRSEESDNDVAERQLEFLTKQGLDLAFALRVLVTLSRFTVGFVLEEQSELEHTPVLSPGTVERPLLAAAFHDYVTSSQDALFLEGVNAIIEGFGARTSHASSA